MSGRTHANQDEVRDVKWSFLDPAIAERCLDTYCTTISNCFKNAGNVKTYNLDTELTVLRDQRNNITT